MLWGKEVTVLVSRQKHKEGNERREEEMDMEEGGWGRGRAQWERKQKRNIVEENMSASLFLYFRLTNCFVQCTKGTGGKLK